MKKTALIVTITFSIGIGYTQRINKQVQRNEEIASHSLIDPKEPNERESDSVFTISIVQDGSKAIKTCYGLKDKSGEVMVDAIYDGLTPLHPESEYYIITKKEGKGLISRKGTIIIEPLYFAIDMINLKERLIAIYHSRNEVQLANIRGAFLSEIFEEIKPFEGGYIVKQEGKWGTLGHHLKFNLRPNYKSIRRTKNQQLIVKDHYNLLGFYNYSGKLVNGIKYDKIKEVLFKDSLLGYIIERFEHQGFLDSKLNQVIPLQANKLDWITTNKGIIFAMKNSVKNNISLLDINGKPLCKKAFKEIKRSKFNPNLLIVSTITNVKHKETPYSKLVRTNVERFGIINEEGDVLLECHFEKILDFGKDKDIWIQRNNQWCYYDVKAKRIYKTSYSNIVKTSNNQFIVQKGGFKENNFNINGVFGLLDSNFQEIIPIEYEEIEEIFGMDSIYRIKKNGDYGLFNCSGKEILPIEFSHIQINSVGSIIVTRTNYKTMLPYSTLISLTGKVSSTIGPFHHLSFCTPDTLIRFSNNGNTFGIMTNKGKIILDPIYLHIDPRVFNDSLFFTIEERGTLYLHEDYVEYNGGSTGIVNSSGKTLLPCEFSTVLSLEKQWVIATDFSQDKTLTNLVDTSCENFGRFKYLQPLNHNEMLFIAAKEVTKLNNRITINGKFGLMNIDGEYIIPNIYSRLTQNGNFLIGFTLDNKLYRLFDLSGNIIVDSMESILPISDSLFIYRKNEVVKVYNAESKSFVFDVNFIDFMYPESIFRNSHNEPNHSFASQSERSYNNNNNGDPILPSESQYEFYGIKNKKNKWGIINNLGEIVMKPKYDYIKMGEHDLVIAGKLDEETNEINYGVVHVNNEIVVPFDYTNIDFDDYERLLFHCFQGLKYKAKDLSKQEIQLQKQE